MPSFYFITEEFKLAAVEDQPDGDLSRTEVAPTEIIPPTPEPQKLLEKVVAPEKEEEKAPIVAPQQTCHQINEVSSYHLFLSLFSKPRLLLFICSQTEPPKKEETKEEEFQLPSVKNLRSHFEGANNSNNFSKKEPAYVPKKLSTPKFNAPAVPQVNLNNNIVSKPVPPKIVESVSKVQQTAEVREQKKEVPNKEEARLPEVQEVKFVPLITKQVSFNEENNACTMDSTSETSNTTNSNIDTEEEEEEEYVEPIMKQFSEDYDEEEILKPRPTTRSWDPVSSLHIYLVFSRYIFYKKM